MKRNYFCGLMLIIALFLMVKVPSLSIQVSAANTDNMDKDLKQISCTEKTVTVKWNSQQGIDKYDQTIKREMDHYTLQVYGMVDGPRIIEYDNPKTITFPENGSKEYKTTLNLPTNYWGKVRINLTYHKYIKNAETDKYEFDQTVTDSSELFCNVRTKPLRPTKNQFGIPANTSVSNLSLESWIEVKAPNMFYKRQLELYKGNTKLKTFDLSYVYDADFNLKKGCVYQYRVRYYIGGSSGEKIYSDWSQWKGFVVPNKLGFSSSASKKGFKITLGKISGVSKYTVYTSLKKNSGFKKAKTFKAKSKKFSVQIKKGYKKGKKNYIKLVPYINLKYYKGPSEFAIVTPRPLKIYK